MSGKPILHEYAASGNCYKVRLTAAHAGIELDRREYDIMKGETRTPEFLANVNANGRIPVLQIGDRFRLADQDGRALRADQARTAIQGRFLEVGDGQGDVAIRTNDPCVEVLRHNCIFIQQSGRRNTVCGFHPATAQSGTRCCNRLLVSGGPRPYRSIHALSPNSLTAHLPPPPAV